MEPKTEKSAAQTFFESHDPASLATICGGAWRIEATELVRAFLVEHLPDGFPVYA